MANKIDLQALLEQLSALNTDDLKTVNSQARALKRDRAAKAEKEKLEAVFAPLFDAIDEAIVANPILRELIGKKDAIRIYFTNEQQVNRDTYHSYGQRTGEGGGNGTKVWHRKDGKILEFPSGRAMCNYLEIVNDGASFRADCKKHKVAFLEVRPEGEVTIVSE